MTDGQGVALGVKISSSLPQTGINIGYASQAPTPYFKGVIDEVEVLHRQHELRASAAAHVGEN